MELSFAGQCEPTLRCSVTCACPGLRLASTSQHNDRDDALQAEADLAAALFQELRLFLLSGSKQAPADKTYSVGVITPYKQQAAVLRRTFRELAGDEAASEVRSGFSQGRVRMKVIVRVRTRAKIRLRVKYSESAL